MCKIDFTEKVDFTNSNKYKELAEGSVGKSFTQKEFVTVVPQPAIDKVKWSIVKTGSKGADHNDFSMKMDDMIALCEEFDNKTLVKKLADDVNSQYPSAYCYVGGNKGAKKLNIGGGQKGVRINIMNPGNTPKNIAIPYSDLRSIIWWFEFIFGLMKTPPTGPYFEAMYNAYWSNEANRQKYYKKEEDKEDNYVPDLEQNPDPAPAPTPAAPVFIQQAAEQKEEEAPKLKRCSLYTSSSIVEWKAHPGSYMLQMTKEPLVGGKVASGSPVVNVAIMKDVVDEICERKGKEVFDSFVENVNNTYTKDNASVKVGFIYSQGVIHSKNGDVNILYLQDILM